MDPALQLQRLDAPASSARRIGGKAQALSVLASAGLPVPAGFVIPAAACAALMAGGAAAVSVQSAIVEHYLQLDASSAAQVPVAVRSSATYEDQAEQSAAGQHDSFLHVAGTAALLAAVRDCGLSARSDRAEHYRQRLHIEAPESAIAVIVQRMVPATVSGVLFTAHPVSGERETWVLNATSGTGDALVAGAVTADSFVVDPRQPLAQVHPLLSAAAQTRLIALAARTLALFGDRPQDIEWACVDEDCWLLQARPITQLPEPLPDVQWLPPAGMQRLIRRQVVENMPGPLSTLFQDLYLNQGLDAGMVAFSKVLQLPVGIEDLVARPMFVAVNGYGYARYDTPLRARMLWQVPRLLYWSVRRLPGLMRALIPLWRDQGLPQYLDTVAHWRALEPAALDDLTLCRGISALAYADARYWYDITSMVGAAKVTEGLLAWLLPASSGVSSDQLLQGQASRTLDAQASVHQLAQILRDEALSDAVVSDCTAGLLDLDAAAARSQAFAAALAQHEQTYGHQIYTLDFAEPTQGESREVLRHSLWQRLQPSNQASAPGADTVAVATQRVFSHSGWLRRRLLHRALNWAQRFAPQREQALFYMGAGWPVLRQLAAELGTRLLDRQLLDAVDDVYHLQLRELERALGEPAPTRTYANLARERDDLRKARQRLHPPARVPPDLRIRIGPFDFTRRLEVWETQKHNDPRSPVLHGFPVSAGVVTGVACVVRSPDAVARLPARAILVCATTTPAWTPLFDDAAGLVTDIGGLLAHGSIVAREYGIPAVLGTGDATVRIVSGQLLRVDGSAGTVTILSPP